VVDGQTGYLVPPNNPEALAQKLALLHDSPRTAQRMGWAGMRRAHQSFTWRSVAAQIAAVYEAAIKAASQESEVIYDDQALSPLMLYPPQSSVAG
jgi:glycosyltransferase involved in cell wall biosynthesis